MIINTDRCNKKGACWVESFRTSQRKTIFLFDSFKG